MWKSVRTVALSPAQARRTMVLLLVVVLGGRLCMWFILPRVFVNVMIYLRNTHGYMLSFIIKSSHFPILQTVTGMYGGECCLEMGMILDSQAPPIHIKFFAFGFEIMYKHTFKPVWSCTIS